MKCEFSPDQKYRYTLWRDLDNSLEADRPYIQFVLLNPSTADDTKDDATVRVCKSLTKLWGYHRFCITNLFAYRSKDAHHMMSLRHPLAVGPQNDFHLLDVCREAAMVIAAWGTWGVHQYRDEEVGALLDVQLFCIALTNAGMPHHPLRVILPDEPTPYTVPIRPKTAPDWVAKYRDKATKAFGLDPNRP